MNTIRHSLLVTGLVVVAAGVGSVPQQASAATAAQLNAQGTAALHRLYAQSDRAVRYGRDAHAVVGVTKVVKAGFIVGGQGGEGVLFVRGKPAGYYKIGALSYGLQAGGQSFSYALFLMNEKSIAYLQKSDGWAIGSGPSVVVVDKGAAMSTEMCRRAQSGMKLSSENKNVGTGL